MGADGWIEYYGHEHYSTVVGLDELDGVEFNAAAVEPPWFTLYDWLPGHTKYRHFLDTDQYTGQIEFAGFGQPPNVGLHPGISEYSNYNFFSDDTIFSYYPHPAKVADTDYESVFPLSGTISYTSRLTSPPPYTYVRKDEPASLGIESNFILCAGRDVDASLARSTHFPSPPVPHRIVLGLANDEVMKGYCELLLPKAIAYCTDFVNFFFRGRLGVELVGNCETGLLELTITNLSDGTLTQGGWDLYQDNENGFRHLILGVNWSSYPGTLAPGQSFMVTFAPMTSANGQYTLVFKADGAPEDDFTIEVVAKSFVPPVGACCDPFSVLSPCSVLEKADCDALNRVYMGDDSICQDDTCDQPCCECVDCCYGPEDYAIVRVIITPYHHERPGDECPDCVIDNLGFDQTEIFEFVGCGQAGSCPSPAAVFTNPNVPPNATCYDMPVSVQRCCGPSLWSATWFGDANYCTPCCGCLSIEGCTCTLVCAATEYEYPETFETTGSCLSATQTCNIYLRDDSNTCEAELVQVGTKTVIITVVKESPCVYDPEHAPGLRCTAQCEED